MRGLFVRATVLLVVVTLGSGILRASEGEQATGEISAETGRALLDRYCVSCHNSRLLTGDLALDAVDVSNVAEDPEIWETVVRKLRAGRRCLFCKCSYS